MEHRRKIIGLIEEAVAKAAVKVQRDFRSSRSMPLTRDTFNDVIESVTSKSLADENDTDRSASELPTDPYTFELVSYEQERKCLRVLSLIYGISGHKGLWINGALKHRPPQHCGSGWRNSIMALISITTNSC